MVQEEADFDSEDADEEDRKFLAEVNAKPKAAVKGGNVAA